MFFRGPDFERGLCDEPYCGDYYDTREDPDAGNMVCGRCVRWRRWHSAGRAHPEDAEYSDRAYLRFLAKQEREDYR